MGPKVRTYVSYAWLCCVRKGGKISFPGRGRIKIEARGLRQMFVFSMYFRFSELELRIKKYTQ